jgi:hypothetical protein
MCWSELVLILHGLPQLADDLSRLEEAHEMQLHSILGSSL